MCGNIIKYGVYIHVIYIHIYTYMYNVYEYIL